MLALLLLFGGVAVWAIWFRGDSIQDQVAALRSQLDVEGITREQRRALFENADPAVRDAMFASRQQEWQAREQKFMNEFFAMSNADQIASLDKKIDEMERWRKAREKRDAERAKAGASANNQSQRNGQNGNAGGRGGAGGQGGRGGGSRDPIARRDNYLARTSADQRAQSNAYRQMMQQRMQQRGMTGFGDGRGFGGGGGGRGRG